VAAAKARGWQALQHRDAADTRRQLRALGVRLPAPFAVD